MPKHNPTTKQADVLDYINRYQQTFGYMPTTRDIQMHFKYASQTSAVHVLDALVKKGFLERSYGSARAIRVIKAILVNENV